MLKSQKRTVMTSGSLSNEKFLFDESDVKIALCIRGED